MQIEIAIAQDSDGEALANLQARAMRESLEQIGRFNAERARARFLSMFDSVNTHKILDNQKLVGFYVLLEKPDHFFLDHFYIDPAFQGNKIGSRLLTNIIQQGKAGGKAIKLRALKQSRSNAFYRSLGFIKTHEEELDNCYCYSHSAE